MLFYANQKVFIYHFGEVCICRANRSIVIAVLHVPKEFPATLSIKGSNRCTDALTLCRLNRKHLYSTITFWKQQQQQQKQDPQKQEKFFKKSLNCLILYSHESLEQLQTKRIYIHIYMCVCMYIYVYITFMLLLVTHTLLGRSAYTQQG